MQPDTIKQAKPVGLGVLITLALSSVMGGNAPIQFSPPGPAHAARPGYAPAESGAIVGLTAEISAYKKAVAQMGEDLSRRLDRIDEKQTRELDRLRERVAAIEARPGD